ncbi:MAG: tetratricopeptide repeat protein [Myxococcaceae bacterium]|nr:tetratricopeptide repeat protein [Myxococcaceae bacterium]MCI0669774.1 tetratricopeptide repeat protein [Myxococcaceae bacterium]
MGLFAAGGAFLYLRLPTVDVQPSRVAPALILRAPSPELDKAVARWRRAIGKPGGTAREHVEKGRDALATGTRERALRAEAHFQRALVLEPGNDTALAGWVQAFALGHAARMEEPEYREALALAEEGLARSVRAPDMLVSTAQILLARPGQSDVRERVRTLASEALGSHEPGVQAEAHVALARLQLEDSLALAMEHLDKAEALRPGMGRVSLVRALALEFEGRYGPALELLRKRVSEDPGDVEALRALGRLHAELGQSAQARSALEARRGAGGVELGRALAVLLYQSDGAQPREAVRVLRQLLEKREGLEQRDAAELLVHLAAAERAQGNAAAARRAAEDALRVAPEDPAAHLQLLMLALGRRDAEAAARHLKGFAGRSGDAGLEALLEGRVLVLQRRPAEAMERFLEAVKRDARRVDAQLWAGAAAALAGRGPDAFRLLLAAQAMDPARTAPPTRSERFFLRAGETLEGAEGHLLKLARGPDVLHARLYEALIRFHQRDLRSADRLARDVLAADVRNAAAYSLRTLVALAQGNRKAALELGAQAERNGRQLALARYAHGEALAASGDSARALQAMREALALAPGLPTLAVRLAELEAATGARDVAREQLLKMVARDRSDRAAKRALYAIDRRG